MIEENPIQVLLRVRESSPSALETAEVRVHQLVSSISSYLSKRLTEKQASIGFRHEIATVLLNQEVLLTSLADGMSEELVKHSSEDLKRLAILLAHARSDCDLAVHLARNGLAADNDSHFRHIVGKEFSTVSLAGMVAEMVDSYGYQARAKDVIFEVIGLDDLPDIKGHPQELRRLFHNVLSNAVKYSHHTIHVSPHQKGPQAGPPPRRRFVSINGDIHDPGFRSERVKIEFKNFGTGVPRPDWTRVFDHGWRGEQARREEPIGAGIGLSEAKKIVELHGGSIHFESERQNEATHDQGVYLTCVTVVLPVYSSNNKWPQA